MKVKVGMRVSGECGEGVVIAMTKEWCIFRMDRPGSDGKQELAEPWECVHLEFETPKEGQEVSSVTSGEAPRAD